MNDLHIEQAQAPLHLPALLDYVLSRPVVSAGMIAEELRITPPGTWLRSSACARQPEGDDIEFGEFCETAYLIAGTLKKDSVKFGESCNHCG